MPWIPQCNNSYIFPGIGLGAVSGKATGITENMLIASSQALAEYAATHNEDPGILLPKLSKIRQVSQFIAKRVFRQAIDDGVALDASEEFIEEAIAHNFWSPEYRVYKRTAF